MAAVPASFIFGEAFVLGLSSGPACIASCGPVLVPSLLAERSGVQLSTRNLSTFLGARFLGYLLFAAAAWELGALVSVPPARRLLVVGVVHILLAVVLLWYAYSVGHARAPSSPGSELVTIGVGRKSGISGPAALGFLTGFSLCPPFVIAGVRAAQLDSAAAALLFFAVFFMGTSLWFVPFISLGCVRRSPAVTTVARMAMALIAVFYLSVGLAMLMGRNLHGY